jgi:hypothetical protein
VLSVFGVIVAFGLAGLAVCLIVFSSTHKWAVLGAITGGWSALIGYLAIYGVRGHAQPVIVPAAPGGELALVGSREVETTRDADARREYEERLQSLVQSELAHISDAMNEQLHALRDQVAELRGELVEKVGGQLRLERVETTRVIGSNIEALQHEVRRLAVGRDDLGQSFRRSDPVEIHAAEPITAPIAPPVPPPIVVPVAPPIQQPPVAPSVQAPVAAPVASMPPVAPAAPEVAPAPSPTLGSDPFAGLPRLTRFVDDDAASETRELPKVGESRGHRHATEDEVEPPKGRHAGGRRRRDDDEPNDILQRLLADR